MNLHHKSIKIDLKFRPTILVIFLSFFYFLLSFNLNFFSISFKEKFSKMQASWGLLETYFVKFSKTSVIDNVTFRLHYKLTCYFLLMCSALSTCYQHFGKPINCIKRTEAQVGKSLKISSKHLN